MASLLNGELRVLTAGAPLFADALASQGVAVEPVDWRPPAEGDAELRSINLAIAVA